MKNSVHVLLIDDDEDEFFLTRGLLSDRSYSSEGNKPIGFQLDWVATYEGGLREIESGDHDVYLVDYHLGERDGLELVQEAVIKGSLAPFILMTGQGSYEVDLKAMQVGATDYLVKGEVTAALLERSIRYAIERKRSEEKIRRNAERAELLAALSHTFAEAGLNLNEVLNTVAYQVSEQTGDGCIIRLISEDLNWLDPVVIHHPDPRLKTDLIRKENENRIQVSDDIVKNMLHSDKAQLFPGQSEKIADNSGKQDKSSTHPGARKDSRTKNGAFQSALLAPLRVKDDLIGVLALVRPRSKAPYADEDKIFLQDLANRAALVIENARLYAAETQRASELDALHRATAALLTTIELDLLLSRILDIAQSAIPVADRALLHLAVTDTGEAKIQGTENLHDPRLKTIRLPRSQSCSPAALRDKFPLLIGNLTTIPDLSGTCFSQTGLPVEFHGSGSAIIAPLILQQEILGLLSLTSSRVDAFGEADQRLLTSFANTTTTALGNAMLHAEVQQLAITDSLTEIYNRRGFFDLGRREIDRALRFGRPLSAIMVDIDDFKEINDTFGHAVGDQVLRIIAERLRTSVREVDILGRYGGDEFVILLPETESRSAIAAAERVRVHLAEPVVIQQIQPGILEGIEPLSLTASLGVSSMEGKRMELAALLANADAAAYLAKQRGRNRVEVL